MRRPYKFKGRQIPAGMLAMMAEVAVYPSQRTASGTRVPVINFCRLRSKACARYFGKMLYEAHRL